MYISEKANALSFIEKNEFESNLKKGEKHSGKGFKL